MGLEVIWNADGPYKKSGATDLSLMPVVCGTVCFSILVLVCSALLCQIGVSVYLVLL